MSPITALFQCGISIQCNTPRKRNEKHKIGKEEVEWSMFLTSLFMENILTNLTEKSRWWISQVCNTVGCSQYTKRNFICMQSSEYLENEIYKNIIYNHKSF